MKRLGLFVFTVDAGFAADVVAAGAAGVVVDWENRGKQRRQAGADTEVNAHTPADLARVRAATPGRVLCRIDGYGPHTRPQIEAAVALGADEVLLPMVRRPEEVDRTLELVAGRCGVGILIETREAVACAGELARRPLTRVYVGLNDLRIARRSSQLFEPLVDGTVDRVREAVAVPFGVAGLTRADAGHPVPSRLLAAELVRLRAGFTFLRRSFMADVAGRDLAVELPRILQQVEAAGRRTPAEVVADRAELVAAVSGAGAAVVRQAAPGVLQPV